MELVRKEVCPSCYSPVGSYHGPGIYQCLGCETYFAWHRSENHPGAEYQLAELVQSTVVQNVRHALYIDSYGQIVVKRDQTTREV